MPRFFVCPEQIENGIVTVTGDDAHHISRSLRMAAGEKITVCDMQKREYECELTDFLPDRVLARILYSGTSETEPPYWAHVFQALPKGDKLDHVIQKSVECGASELTTFESTYCVAHAKEESEEKKLERRQRIALEAAKQSGRGIVPTVHPTVSFQKALLLAAESDVALICYEGEAAEPLPTVLQWACSELAEAEPLTISLMIGSEGGFSLEEVKMAKEYGLIPVGLGKRILRTETAASFALACLSYELELLPSEHSVADDGGDNFLA